MPRQLVTIAVWFAYWKEKKKKKIGQFKCQETAGCLVANIEWFIEITIAKWKWARHIKQVKRSKRQDMAAKVRLLPSSAESKKNKNQKGGKAVVKTSRPCNIAWIRRISFILSLPTTPSQRDKPNKKWKLLAVAVECKGNRPRTNHDSLLLKKTFPREKHWTGSDETANRCSNAE